MKNKFIFLFLFLFFVITEPVFANSWPDKFNFGDINNFFHTNSDKQCYEISWIGNDNAGRNWWRSYWCLDDGIGIENFMYQQIGDVYVLAYRGPDGVALQEIDGRHYVTGVDGEYTVLGINPEEDSLTVKYNTITYRPPDLNDYIPPNIDDNEPGDKPQFPQEPDVGGGDGGGSGGFFDSIFNFFSNLFSFLTDMFRNVLSEIGKVSKAVLDGFGNLLATMAEWFTTIFGLLGNLLTKLGDWFTSLFDFLSNIIKAISDSFSDLISKLSQWFLQLFEWINPLSENFILRIAFIPRDGYFDNYVTQFRTMVEIKLGAFTQFIDTFNAVVDAIKNNTIGWQGIVIDIPQFNIYNLEIINSQIINEYGNKLRFWIGGMMIFFTVAWLIRKISFIIAEGK